MYLLVDRPGGVDQESEQAESSHEDAHSEVCAISSCRFVSSHTFFAYLGRRGGNILNCFCVLDDTSLYVYVSNVCNFIPSSPVIHGLVTSVFAPSYLDNFSNSLLLLPNFFYVLFICHSPHFSTFPTHL